VWKREGNRPLEGNRTRWKVNNEVDIDMIYLTAIG
jgi:hypothetical protein